MSKDITKRTIRLNRYSLNSISTIGYPDELQQSAYLAQFAVENRRAHGGPMPRFREMIRNGVNATTTFNGSKFSYQNQVANLQYKLINPYAALPGQLRSVSYRNYGAWAYLGPPPDANPSFVAPSRAVGQAVVSFLKKAKRRQNVMQSGVFLGELKEAIHAVRNPAESLFRGVLRYSDLAKKRGRAELHTRNVNRTLSKTWLEFAFGWSPLVKDLDDACAALARTMSKPFLDLERIQGYGQDRYVSEDFGGSVVTGNMVDSYNVRYEELAEAWVYGAIKSENGSSSTGFAPTFGLTLRDFVPTIWELIPYSFLVDYFTNIGELLEASSWSQSGISWATTTTKVTVRKYTTNYDRRFLSIPSGWLSESSGNLGRSSWSVTSVTRIPTDVLSLPFVQFKVPGLGSLKWLNMGALAAAKAF